MMKKYIVMMGLMGLVASCNQSEDLPKDAHLFQNFPQFIVIHPQKKAMPKNVQTTTQLHSSHTLVK